MKNILVLVILFTFSNIKAQINIDYTTSDNLKDSKYEILLSGAVTHDGERAMIVNGYGLTHGEKKKYEQHLLMFDKDMKIIADQVIKDIRIISIISMKENSYFLYFDKEDNLKMRLINEETYTGVGEEIEILAMKKNFVGPRYIGNFIDKPKVVVSQDSTKIAFLVEEKSKEKGKRNYVSAVYNENISKLWGKRFNLGIKEREYKLSDIKVGNDGALYISLANRISAEVFDNYFDYRIYRITKDTQKSYENNVFMNDGSAVGNKIIDNSDGIDLLSTVYKDKEIKYLTISRLDQNLDLINKNTNEVSYKNYSISEDDKKKGRTKKSTKSKQKTSNIKIRNLSILDNGKKFIVAEKHREHTNVGASVKDNEIHSPTTIYYYTDIIISLFNKEGEVQWSKKIPKNQIGINDISFGISVFVGEENAYIIYIDHEKNNDPDREKLKTYNSYKKGIYKIVKIDLEEGYTEEEVMFSVLDEKILIEPVSHFQLKDGTLIIMGYQKRGKSALMINFLDE